MGPAGRIPGTLGKNPACRNSVTFSDEPSCNNHTEPSVSVGHPGRSYRAGAVRLKTWLRRGRCSPAALHRAVEGLAAFPVVTELAEARRGGRQHISSSSAGSARRRCPYSARASNGDEPASAKTYHRKNEPGIQEPGRKSFPYPFVEPQIQSNRRPSSHSSTELRR